MLLYLCIPFFFFLMIPPPPRSTLFPYTTLFRSLHRKRRPRGWGRQRDGFVMARPGRLTASFAVRRSGSWDLWLQGQFMARVAVAIDGRALASVEGQLGGNSIVPDTVGPLAVRLRRGVHRL